MEIGPFPLRLLAVLSALAVASIVSTAPDRRCVALQLHRRNCWSLGALPAAIAVYRLFGSLNSVLEHSNIRFPRWLDRILVWLWVTPDMHKVHHSRERSETDSNYSNLLSFFDRLFGTFTPSARGPLVRYGIHGYDAPEQHSIGAVLWLPLADVRVADPPSPCQQP